MIFFPVVENGTAKDTVSARLDALTQTEIKIRERKHPPVPALYELYQTLAQARKQRKISGNEVNAHSTGNNPLLLCGTVVLSTVTNTIWFFCVIFFFGSVGCCVGLLRALAPSFVLGWPSGPRRLTQVQVSSDAWVRIPLQADFV